MANDMARMFRLLEEAKGALKTLADEAHVKAEYAMMRDVWEMIDTLKLIEKETFNIEE